MTSVKSRMKIDKDPLKLTSNEISNKLERVGVQHVCKIIDLLREQPVLWNTKCNWHSLRNERQRAFEVIMDKILEQYPMLDIDTKYIMNKIQYLKHLYHNYNKNSSKYSTENHKKYYEMLEFLRDRDAMNNKNSCDTDDFFLENKMIDNHRHESEMPRTEKRICEYCGRQFKAQQNLRIHMKTVHLQLRSYACSVCPKTFKTGEKLKTHRNSVHLNVRNHICEVCAEGFASRNTMIQHRRLHCDAMNYVCRVCGKGFRQAPALYAHVRTHRYIKAEQ